MYFLFIFIINSFILLLYHVAQRLDDEIKEILDDFANGDHKKETLLNGRCVTIAEELSE